MPQSSSCARAASNSPGTPLVAGARVTGPVGGLMGRWIACIKLAWLKQPATKRAHRSSSESPPDLAERLASFRFVPPRQRSQFPIQLLRRESERESQQLSEAAQRLTQLESGEAELEIREWVDSELVDDTDPFDAAEFERQFRAAQSTHEEP